MGRRVADALGNFHLLHWKDPCEDSSLVSFLPDDQLIDIFRRLPIRQRLTAQLVCTRWRDLVSQPELWTHIELKDVPHFSAEQVANLIGLSGHDGGGYGLQVLDASGCYGTDVGHLIPLLKQCTNLQRLRAVRGPTGRPLVTAENLEELVTLGASEPAVAITGQGRPRHDVTPDLWNGSSVPAGECHDPAPNEAAEDLRERWPAASCQLLSTGRPVSSQVPRARPRRPRRVQLPAGAVEVDLEVDWSTAEEFGETATQLSEAQWRLVFQAVGGAVPHVSIRALYIEIFAAEETWPRLLAALRANPGLRELYLVCLHCEAQALEGMLSGLADALEGDSCLEVLQVKYAEFRSVRSVRPLVRLCSSTGTLRRLEIVKCNYEGGAEVGLAEILLADPPLEELVVDVGGKAGPVAAGLAGNTRLKILRLRGITEAGVVALAEAIKGSDSLRELDLRHMMVTPGGLTAIAAAVQSNTSLTSLRLDHGDIDYFLPTEEILAGMEAVVAAVQQRGGMPTLGLSVSDAFWPTSSRAPFLSFPKRFYEPPLARLVKGPRPLVETLHITTPWEEWHAGDAAAWRVWFNLSRAAETRRSGAGEAAARKGEGPRVGVAVQLLHDSLGGAETWETHAWVPEAGRHVPHVRSPLSRALDLVLLVLFPVVHLWQSVDAMYHVDCSGWNCLDWIFIGPLACFRTLGLVAGLLTLYLVMYAQAIVMCVYETAKRSVLWAFGVWAPAGAPPKHPLRTPEGHRLLRNMV